VNLLCNWQAYNKFITNKLHIQKIQTRQTFLILYVSTLLAINLFHTRKTVFTGVWLGLLPHIFICNKWTWMLMQYIYIYIHTHTHQQRYNNHYNTANFKLLNCIRRYRLLTCHKTTFQDTYLLSWCSEDNWNVDLCQNHPVGTCALCTGFLILVCSANP